MPRRSAVGPDAIAALPNLLTAFFRAAKGRRHQREVIAYEAQLSDNLSRLAVAIRRGEAPVGDWSSFTVYDPKERLILAPAFADRVFHHALMAQIGPVLDRGLVDDTFACRTGKGNLRAVLRCQQHSRRFAVVVGADVRAYFATIDHGILMGLLARRFKHPLTLGLCAQVLERRPGPPGVGLPIGALTSQHFANLYLDGLDRYLQETLKVRGYVRYMDDLRWWVDDAARGRETLAAVRAWALTERALVIKPQASIGASARGVSFLGFRVWPGRLGLGPRRRRRYVEARARWEGRYLRGEIDVLGLQQGITAAIAITAHAEAVAWRRGELQRRPPVDA